MEVLRRKKDEDKSKQELEKEQSSKKHGETGTNLDVKATKVQKDNSLEVLLEQQKKDWEQQKIQAEKDSQIERPTLHTIELPNLKPAGFGVWRALHEMSYPLHADVIADLEASGIPASIQERFKIGFVENIMDAGQQLAMRFKQEEFLAAGIPLLKDYAMKKVPVLIFPYFRDDEICFMSCRALLSSDERRELDIPRYIRLGEKIPFPYNAGVFSDILVREKKKVFFLYPSRYRLNILSKEEDVLIVAEKGFDAIAIRAFYIEDDWYRLFINVEPVVIVDPHDRSFPEWQKKLEILKEQFNLRDMVMRIEVLPEGVDVPGWFVKSNLGERKVRFDKPADTKSKPEQNK
jgi:hypothetical protein